jgi:hypothetical protein
LHREEGVTSADRWIIEQDMKAYLDSLPEPDDVLLAELDRQPLTTDEQTVGAEWPEDEYTGGWEE